MYFLGIDGGGTKTRYLLIDEQGYVLDKTVTDSIHMLQTGIEVFKNNLKTGIEKVCNETNILPEDIKHTFLGIPGYGDEIRNEDINILEKTIKKVLNSSNFKCGNDVEAGWAGSLACKPGINLVAGTGAIGFGRDNKNNKARSSGWGYFYGDEGSAYWLGKQMISYFTKEADERINKTPLYNIIKHHFNIDNDFEIIDILYEDYGLDRKKIASLAKILYKAAVKGDEVAIKLYKKAAYEHSLTIKAIINKLNFDNDAIIKVSYSGGVFKSGEYILKPLKNQLENGTKNIELIKPILKPVTGAALYAKLLFEGNMNYQESILKRLIKHEKEDM